LTLNRGDNLVPRLNCAKIVYLSLVDADYAGYLVSRLYKGLQEFFEWYKQRMQAENPPQLVVMIDNFLIFSLTEESLRSRYTAPIRQLSVQLCHTYFPGSNILLKDSVNEIGYILSDEVSNLLHPNPSHPRDLARHYQAADHCLADMMPWALVGNDHGCIRYSPKVDFRRMPQ